MFPVLLEVGSWQMQSYGFFIALGYLAALILATRLAARDNLPPGRFADLCFLALVSGVIGARLVFVATNWPHFREHPRDALFFWEGGLVFYGGFALAAAVCGLYLRSRSLPLWRSLDVLAPALALGHALGRLGCFAAGCCHGSFCPYPWGIALYSPLVQKELRGLPLHPTQLYESFGLGLLTWVLLRLRQKKKPGLVTAAYVSGYALLRFVVEMFRGDSVRGFVPGTPLSTSQAFALGLFALGGGLLVRCFRRNH